MKLSGIEIHQGGKIPKWYGISYWKPDRDIAVCYPLVINQLVRHVRNLYYWLYFKIGRPRGVSLIEGIKFDSYQSGYADGYEKAFTEYIHDFLTSEQKYHEGFKEGREFAFKTMESELKK